MKQFRFKLQAVLEYRSDQVDLVQQKVAKEEKIRLDILDGIAECDRMIALAYQEQQKMFDQEAFDPVRAQSFPAYLFRLKQTRFEQTERLRQQEHVLLAVRDELKQALIKKKSLDILKEKEQARYTQKILKLEADQLEEIALTRHLQKQRQLQKAQ